MLENKRKWLVLMAIVSSISMISTSFAADILGLNTMHDSYRHEDRQRVEDLIYDTLVQGPCIECERGRLVSICAADKDYQGSKIHGKDGCVKSVYYSRGALMCSYCAVIAEEFGNHWCWETHTVCNKGNHSMCPMFQKDEDESGLP